MAQACAVLKQIQQRIHQNSHTLQLLEVELGEWHWPLLAFTAEFPLPCLSATQVLPIDHKDTDLHCNKRVKPSKGLDCLNLKKVWFPSGMWCTIQKEKWLVNGAQKNGWIQTNKPIQRKRMFTLHVNPCVWRCWNNCTIIPPFSGDIN